jgi:heme exporter protein A
VTTAIELDGVGRAYGERAALVGVTLTVQAGQTLVVFGPNGAGKSTLLRPTAGTARLFGCEIPREAWKVRGRVGLLGHEPLLYRELSARQNLRYHARLRQVPAARIDELLDAVGLARRADDPVSTYSRGMVQRAALARAVLHEPELLLLDEPLANLDPVAAEHVDALVGAGTGLTRVVTSHDPTGGLRDADLVLGLRDERAVLSAPARDVAAADVRRLYT